MNRNSFNRNNQYGDEPPYGYGNYDSRELRRRKVKRKTRFSHKVLLVFIFAVYIALLGSITYFRFYKPASVSNVFSYEVTDENGNRVTYDTKYTTVDGSYNILLLGRDVMASLTDVFMLINVNNNDAELSVMQLPRDTYVSDGSGADLVSGKLNELFASYYLDFINSGLSQDDACSKALEKVKESIEKSFCITISNSAILNLDGFKNIVDAVGGVELYVENPMTYNDPEQGLYIDIPSGYQVLDGNAAEGFVRFRSGYIQGDLGRVNAQKMFMSAFFNKIKSTVSIDNLSKLSALAGELSKNLISDFSIGDLSYFGQSVLRIDYSNFRMVTLPGEMYDNTHYVMVKKSALDIINSYFNTYDKNISEVLFDRDMMFTDRYNEEMMEIYRSDGSGLYDPNIYSGSELEEEGINIPRK